MLSLDPGDSLGRAMLSVVSICIIDSLSIVRTLWMEIWVILVDECFVVMKIDVGVASTG